MGGLIPKSRDGVPARDGVVPSRGCKGGPVRTGCTTCTSQLASFSYQVTLTTYQVVSSLQGVLSHIEGGDHACTPSTLPKTLQGCMWTGPLALECADENPPGNQLRYYPGVWFDNLGRRWVGFAVSRQSGTLAETIHAFDPHVLHFPPHAQMDCLNLDTTTAYAGVDTGFVNTTDFCTPLPLSGLYRTTKDAGTVRLISL